MRHFRDLSINRKLILTMLVIASVSVFGMSLTFIAYDHITTKSAMKRDLSVLADMVSMNSIAPLTFEDEQTARETLAGLQANSHVTLAYLYGSDGRVFAEYRRHDYADRSGPSNPQPGHIGFTGSHLELFRMISQEGTSIGTIFIQSDLDLLQERTKMYGGMVALVLLFSAIIGTQGVLAFRRVFTIPLLDLADTVREVSFTKDYATRAQKRADDELGFLTDRFNQMLSEIQARDEALQGSERYFRSLIENGSDVITVLGPDKRVCYVSPSIERILGYSVDEMMGRGLYWAIHRDDLGAVRQFAGELHKRPDMPCSAAIRYRHQDGTWRDMEIIGRSLLDDPGVRGIVINSRDVTERKQAARALETYAAELERSNQELESFAYVASHDLQEPLRKIRAFGDRLNTRYGDVLEGRGQDYLGRMTGAAERMQQLINDLLAYSRVTTKAKPFESVDLKEIAEAVASDLEIRIEETGASLKIGSLPEVHADPLQMRQLFQNLMGNALKFHRIGTRPNVKVACQMLEASETEGPVSDGGICQIKVSDDGIGFDEKHLDRIFGIFQRLHGRGDYEGTGVGLAICRKIVERHRGQITAQSKPGEGATFIVTLPVSLSRGEDE